MSNKIFNSKKIAAQFLISVFLFLIINSCRNNTTGIEDTYWKTASPESQNVNSNLLNILESKIESGNYGKINSLLIIKNGFLIYEKYFNGFSKEQLHPMYSVTKSVTSALIGIAIDQQKINNLEQKVLSFFPEYSDLKNLDSNKKNMQLKNLLMMQAGLEWNESNTSYNDPQNPVRILISSSDWIKHILDMPMQNYPGEKFRYNSACTILLAGIIKNTSGISAQEFANNFLFKPIGFKNFIWEEGPNKITNTGWGLSAAPRDIAKIGLLFLNKGSWDNAQIISESWTNFSTKNYVSVSGDFSYGYQWWTMPIKTIPNYSSKPDDIKIAWGWGGQFIFIIPFLNMVVVSTAENFEGNTDEAAIDFLQNYIIKAAY